MAQKISGLTQKQRDFARLVASGETGAGAYKQVYSKSAAANTAASAAWRLMQKEDIKREIDVINARKEAAIVRKSLGDRERVLAKFREWTETATPQDSNKIRAAEALAKCIGLYKDAGNAESADNLSADDLKRELQAKLASIMKGSDAKN